MVWPPAHILPPSRYLLVHLCPPVSLTVQRFTGLPRVPPSHRPPCRQDRAEPGEAGRQGQACLQVQGSPQAPSLICLRT